LAGGGMAFSEVIDRIAPRFVTGAGALQPG
jgi:hypothetical protein